MVERFYITHLCNFVYNNLILCISKLQDGAVTEFHSLTPDFPKESFL